jgi:hypothetical protein
MLSEGNLVTEIPVCGLIVQEFLLVVGHVCLMCFICGELPYVNIITLPELLYQTVIAVKAL